MVKGKTVTVEFKKRDRHQRIVGKITLDGTDICLEQIKAGLAWHYKKYEKEQPELTGRSMQPRRKRQGSGR